MWKRWMTACVAGVMLLAGWQTADAQAVKRYLLRTKSAELLAVAARHGVTIIEVLRDDGTDATALVEAPVGADEDSLASRLHDDGLVNGFEPNGALAVTELRAKPVLQQSTAAILEAFRSTAPVGYFGAIVPAAYASQTAGNTIKIADAWSFGTGNSVIAVIDTGVDATHPALAGAVLPGYDFTRNTAGVASDIADLSQSTAAILEQSTAAILEQKNVFVVNQSTAAILEQSTAAILEGLPPAFGHGTMVAGLIHYVAPTARILPLKAFHADGTAILSDIVRAIYYAVDNGARIINMSFSTTTSSEELMRAVAYANSRNVIVVAAAGNEGYEAVVFPAGYRPVIAVGSTTARDTRAAFSNYGVASVSIAAPGETLVTAYPGAHWAAVSGTSFSTALLSGGAALMVNACPAISQSQIRDDMSKGAVQISGLGDGRVSLKDAVARAARRNK